MGMFRKSRGTALLGTWGTCDPFQREDLRAGSISAKLQPERREALKSECGARSLQGRSHFLAEFSQHIPPNGSHLIRYYGWNSNKSRGLRKKAAVVVSAEAPAAQPAEQATSQRVSQAWAMLIKRAAFIQKCSEVDPLYCPECGGQMKVISFIEPPQADVIDAILKRCGLWDARSPRGPPDEPPDVHELVFELDAASSKDRGLE